MKFHFCIFLFFLAAAGLSAAGEKNAWGCYVPQKTGSVFSTSGNSLKSCKFNLERGPETQGRIWCAAIANIRQSMWSQNKLAFSCRNTAAVPLNFSCDIVWKSGPNSGHSSSKAFTALPGEWHDIVLSLDDDFRLHDAEHTILQLKFFAEITAWKPGTKGSFEIKNIRFCTPAELSLSGSMSGKVTVIPPQKKNFPVPVKNNTKIYFHFDNEDNLPIPFDWKMRRLNEVSSADGFRKLLLQGIQNSAVETTRMEDADIIVYNSSRPNTKVAREIAKRVNAGVPLLTGPVIADPEIAAMLPGQVVPVKYAALPERKKLKFPAKEHPANRNAVLNDASFGVYYQLKNFNAVPLLLFEDNTPAVIEIKEKSRHIIVSALGFGSDVLKSSSAARDGWFLRLLGILAKKDFPAQQLPVVKSDSEGFYPGASCNNFGRFGWELGDGLLCENISNKLNVSNGTSEYEFAPDLRRRLLLGEWQLSGKKIPWNLKWSYIGKSTLTSSIKIPANWKGTPLAFVAEKGIDDTAQVFFNGTMIGEVTQNDEEYWMRPHRHLIPEKLIRFGGDNQIKVIVRNLRGNGGFGSCPEITSVSPGNDIQVKVDRINYLGKGGKIVINGKNFGRFDTSLAFPGVRWQFDRKTILMSLHNIARFAAFRQNGSIKIVDLQKNPQLPKLTDSPYLLLFNGRKSGSPLLLVFEKPMKKISAVSNGSRISGLSISAGKDSIGMLMPVWICGAAAADTSRWNNAIPENVAKRIDLWSTRAFLFPDSCTESFRIDRKNKKVEIRNRYSYIKTPNTWNISASPYAPVTPLAMLMKGILFEASEVEARDLPTVFGYFADRNSSNTVYWRLPLPEPDFSMRPHSKGMEFFEELANRHFQSGVRFSAGGGIRAEEWNCVWPGGKVNPWMVNLNMHGFLMGLPVCTENPWIYSPENKIKLFQRLTDRLLLPLEQFQYKLALRYREEPYSKINYTIYMNSPREMATNFVPGTGSKVVYGDSNETVCMFLTCLQHLADRFGQKDLIRANYNTISREIASYLLTQDDYCILASGCVEFGGSWSIDMLNCEYASMMKLARIAEIAGDRIMHDQALYRAARRMVPTLSRLFLQEYAQKHGLLPANGLAAVGFGEAELKFHIKGTPVRGLDLYDLSQGIPEDLVALYSKYAVKRLNQLYLPQVLAFPQNKMDYTLAATLALHGTQSDKQLLERLQSISKNSYLDGRLCKDWGGMCSGSYLTYSIHRLMGKVTIKSAKDLTVETAVFNPAQNTFKIRYTAHDNGELIITSPLRCRTPGFIQNSDGSIHLPSTPGKHDVSIQFSAEQ
ncbi:MAG: hypothetical protein IJW17_07810 [Lentisphaeria bacterium]|nr:hypothetical protein [Lentisphaeria bacterium]